MEYRDTYDLLLFPTGRRDGLMITRITLRKEPAMEESKKDKRKRRRRRRRKRRTRRRRKRRTRRRRKKDEKKRRSKKGRKQRNSNSSSSRRRRVDCLSCTEHGESTMTRRLRTTLVSHRTTRWPDDTANHAKEEQAMEESKKERQTKKK